MPKNDKLVIEKGGKKFLIPNNPDRIRHYLENKYMVSKDQSLAIPKTKPPEEESTLTQVGREIPLGAAAGAGIPETMTPIQDLLKGLKEQAAKMFVRPYTNPGAKSLKEMIEANPGVAIPTGLVNTAKETSKDAGFRNVNLGPGVDVPFLGGMPDYPKFAHDASSLLTQILLLKGGKEAAKTPLAESEMVRGGKAVGKAAAGAPPKIVQSATGAKYAVNKAEKAANVAAREKMSAFEKAKTEREAEVAEQKRIKEERDTKAIEEHKTATQQELARARGKHKSEMGDVKADAKKQAAEYKKNLDEKSRTEAENTKNEATKQVLTKQVESGTKQLTQNIKQTLDNAKKNFDKEYGDFDRKILGKTPQNPKGTLQANLNPAVQAVIDAKRNIIEGSEENIKPFQSILGKSERVETASGEMIPLEGQTIPVADLRGYIQELEEKMYDSNLPPDVKRSMASVVKAGKAEVADAIKDVHGQTALDAYDDLNARYSDYLTDWRDTSSTNPLPKVRSKLLEGVAQNNPNYPVHIDIGKTLKGANAQKALVLLEKYRKFGADPKILADYNKALQQLEEIPNPKKVSEVKKPEFESAKSVPLRLKKPPEVEPFKPRGKDPEAPQTEPFNRQAEMRDIIEQRLNIGGRGWQAFQLIKFINDAIHMKAGPALSQAEEIAVVEAIRRAMTSDKALDYFSREAK